jgi:hypothetical protein
MLSLLLSLEYSFSIKKLERFKKLYLNGATHLRWRIGISAGLMSPRRRLEDTPFLLLIS